MRWCSAKKLGYVCCRYILYTVEKLFFGFVGDGDAAEAAGCVDVDGVFGFIGRVFAVIGEAAKDEAGF